MPDQTTQAAELAGRLEDIPAEVLAEQWHGVLQTALSALQSAFRASGMTEREVGDRIRRSPATISSYLRGRQEMPLRTMHDLARAMGYRLRVEIDRPDQAAALLRTQEEEIERLRGALTEIVACDYGTYDKRVEIARDALQPTKASGRETGEEGA